MEDESEAVGVQEKRPSMLTWEGAVLTGDGVLTAKSLVNVATVTSLSPGRLPPSFIPSQVLPLFKERGYAIRE